ncbi:MAG: hypothetical protein RI904_2751 [Pseudomonadota bacterium]
MTLSSTSSQADRLVVLDDKRCRLSGDWNVQALAISGETQRRLALLARVQPSMGWDLTGMTKLDAVGAQLLWKRWGAKLPADIQLTDSQRALFEVLADYPVEPSPAAQPTDLLGWVRSIGLGVFVAGEHGLGMLRMLGEFMGNLGRFILRPSRGPWREISAQVYRVGAQALGITALVGFLIPDRYRAVVSLCAAACGVWRWAIHRQAFGRSYRARAWPDPRGDFGGGPFGFIDHRADWRDARDPRTRRDGGDGDLARPAFDFAARDCSSDCDAAIGALDRCHCVDWRNARGEVPTSV